MSTDKTNVRPRTKAEQRAATRGKLLEVALRHFARDGYAEAATEAIVREADVTRGALYHHFGNKQGLFRAVLESVHAQVGESVTTAAEAAEDDWQALRAGCRAFMAAATDPRIQRVILLDAPAVLGWAEWRRLDARYSMHHLHEHLQWLSDSQQLRPLPLAALTALLSGAMNEASLWILDQTDRAQALTEAEATLDGLLDGLRPTSASA